MSIESEIGSRAPDFNLTADSGREIGLAEYKGKSHVVLFFVREYY
jgi:peroxiredoxin